VVDDLVRVPEVRRPAAWRLEVSGAVKTADGRISVSGEGCKLLGETLLPKKVSTSAGEEKGVKVVEVTPPGKAAETRFLHVFHAIDEDGESPSPAKLEDKDGVLQLTVSAKERTYQLTLPADRRQAGSIAVAKPDGQPLTVRRPLASGGLPNGEKGVRLLERWDSAYHGNRRPGWDVGRPATNLKKAVEDGTIRPGRAAVLGCGTGTNAIYLAKKGFDVTGIDLAPTALDRAEEKARRAGVKVRWLVADVLKPPRLEPFDFIFDRGCYHGVRRHDAAGYVASVKRLSHKGTHLLILAGNANEPRHYGPPRVKEEEIRGDFSKAFDFTWLKETRFDSRDPKREGPWAWSILLKRK